jgi:pyruvate,water dikinase
VPDAPLVLPFGDPRSQRVALAGGKGASLATMTAEGLPVPPGFVVTSAAFEAAVDTDALRELMRRKDVEAARAMVAVAEPPKELIEQHYAELTGPVAVRSSACAEDSEGASYAGQQETYLNTDGLAEVLANVVHCWLSFFTERAVFYRQEKGSLEDVAMAVVVQQMVDSQKSGVLFTVDPVHGRKDRMVAEAARRDRARPVRRRVRRPGNDGTAAGRAARRPPGHRVGVRRRRPAVPAAVASHHHQLRSAR